MYRVSYVGSIKWQTLLHGDPGRTLWDGARGAKASSGWAAAGRCPAGGGQAAGAAPGCGGAGLAALAWRRWRQPRPAYDQTKPHWTRFRRELVAVPAACCRQPASMALGWGGAGRGMPTRRARHLGLQGHPAPPFDATRRVAARRLRGTKSNRLRRTSNFRPSAGSYVGRTKRRT